MSGSKAVADRLRDLASSLRERLPEPLSYKGNIGIALVNITGLPRIIKAHSGYDGRSGDRVLKTFAHLRNKRVFKTLSIPNWGESKDYAYDRKVDTESKILEDIAWRIGYKRLHVVLLYYTLKKNHALVVRKLL